MEQLEVPENHGKIGGFCYGHRFLLVTNSLHFSTNIKGIDLVLFFSDGGAMLMNVLCESGRVIFLVKLGMVQLVFCFLFGWKSRWPEICDNHLALLYELLFACWIFNLQILKR